MCSVRVIRRPVSCGDLRAALGTLADVHRGSPSRGCVALWAFRGADAPGGGAGTRGEGLVWCVVFCVAEFVDAVVVNGVAGPHCLRESPPCRLPSVGRAVLQAEVEEGDLVEDAAVETVGGGGEQVSGVRDGRGEVKKCQAVLDRRAPCEQVFCAALAVAAEGAGAVRAVCVVPRDGASREVAVVGVGGPVADEVREGACREVSQAVVAPAKAWVLLVPGAPPYGRRLRAAAVAERGALQADVAVPPARWAAHSAAEEPEDVEGGVGVGSRV